MESKRKVSNNEDDEAEFEDETTEQVKPASKKTKQATSTTATATTTNNSEANDEQTFSLGQKKKLTLSKFKGKVYINIREYYTDNSGVDKPGKKGIALTEQQWIELKNQITQVDEAFQRLNK